MKIMNTVFQKIDEILKFNGDDIYLTHNGNYIPSGIIEVENVNENSWSLTINLEGEISIFFPSHNLDIIVGRELGYVDKKYDRMFYFGNNQSYLYKIKNMSYKLYTSIDVPQFHMINSSEHNASNETISISCNEQCIINSLHHSYAHFVEVSVVSEKSIKLFIDRSCNYLINLKRFDPMPRRIINAFEMLDFSELNESLFYGCVFQDKLISPKQIMQAAREVQATLLSENIESVIIGSLSRRLNDIKCNVNDLDIMVETEEDLLLASIKMETCADFVSSSEFNRKFNYNGIVVDLSYDNFNVLFSSNYIRKKHGLTYLDAEGLVWIYLILFYNNARLNIFNEYYKKHKISLFNVCDKILLRQSCVSALFNIKNYNDNCIKMARTISSLQQTYRDIRVNEPFQVNGFKNDTEEFFVLINNGSECNVRLVVDVFPKQASWVDVTGRKENLIVEKGNGFSCIFIPKVFFPGYVLCQL